MAGKTVRIKDKRISALIRAIRKKFAPQAIYLFGSRAKGEDAKAADDSKDGSGNRRAFGRLMWA